MTTPSGGQRVRKQTRTFAQILPTLLIIAAIVMLAAAGIIAITDGPNQKEVDDLAQQYTATSDNALSIPVTQDQAECRARAYLNSDLSEGALNDVRNGKPPRPRNEDDIEELNELVDILAECI